MAFDRDKFCILSFDLKNIWSLTFGWISGIMSFFFIHLNQMLQTLKFRGIDVN